MYIAAKGVPRMTSAKQNHSPPLLSQKGAVTLLLLILLLLPLYAHVAGASWQMDDRPNIVRNQALHIQNLMTNSLWDTFFANQGRGGRLFRPVANLSFALNWYLWQDNPTGYRWCNIGLHTLTAFMLYGVVVTFGRTPQLNHCLPRGGWHFAALLTAVLWAAHPIQTQAVTYVVQRMTILAALFYLAGMYAYLRIRLADLADSRRRWAVIGVLCFLLAVGSKENAILLPAALVLLELICFQQPEQIKRRIPTLLPLVMAGGVLMVLGALFFLDFDPLGRIAKSFGVRPFTLWERLLTQPGIVLFYLSLIALPSPDRFSIVHDVELSRTLFQPWWTLPSILLVMAMIGTGLFLIWRRRLIALAILFFFLNHIVESSILPLELIFEHRNYLPSVFLFLPIAVGIWRLLERFKEDHRLAYALIAGLTVLWVMVLGMGTHLRNKDWLTPESLWADALVKAPNNARPWNNFAIRLAWSENPSPEEYAKAYAMFQKSLELDVAREPLRAEIVGNMASILFQTGNYEKAVELYEQALEINPGFNKGRYDMVKALILGNRWDAARRQAERLVADAPYHPDFLNVRGFVRLWQGDLELALIDFRKARSLAPENAGVWMNIGVVLSRLGSYSNGEWFLHQAIKRSPKDLHPRMAVVENALQAGELQRADREARRMIALFPVPIIRSYLEGLPGNKRFAPIAHDFVAPFMLEQLVSECR
jgi:tetratricopeptide (TPR) repeat protein